MDDIGKQWYLIISDMHLKLWMITKAEEIMEKRKLGGAVFLGDGADDFGQERNTSLYNTCFYMIMSFMSKYENSFFCIGNHEAAYLYNKQQSGYSKYATMPMYANLLDMRRRFGNRVAFVHRLENVIFSHAGIIMQFIEQEMPELDAERDVDEIINRINDSGSRIWTYLSPIWARPSMYGYESFNGSYLQVAGHTPVKEVKMVGNILLTDVFSTDGERPIGNEEFVVVNVYDKTYYTVPAKEV